MSNFVNTTSLCKPQLKGSPVFSCLSSHYVESKNLSSFVLLWRPRGWSRFRSLYISSIDGPRDPRGVRLKETPNRSHVIETSNGGRLGMGWPQKRIILSIRGPIYLKSQQLNTEPLQKLLRPRRVERRTGKNLDRKRTGPVVFPTLSRSIGECCTGSFGLSGREGHREKIRAPQGENTATDPSPVYE